MVLLAAVAAGPAASADPAFVASSGDSETVVIPDAALRKAVEAALGKSDGDPVTCGEMATLVRLDAQRGGVRQLIGIECATNLKSLFLSLNEISDLSPLSGLTSLRRLYLDWNEIADVSPLSGLTSLEPQPSPRFFA